MMTFGSGFKQENTIPSAFGKPIGDCCTCRSGADHYVVVLFASSAGQRIPLQMALRSLAQSKLALGIRGHRGKRVQLIAAARASSTA